MTSGELAKRTLQDPSAIGLVIGNLVAAAIAMQHPPITVSLMFIYWAECVVIGVFNVIKLTYVPPLGCDQIDLKGMSFRARVLGKAGTIFLFLWLYGGFCLFCFVMIRFMANHELRDVKAFDEAAYYGGFLLPVAVLAAAHAVSFFVNFLRKREYEGRNGDEQMFRPFLRVGLMWVILWPGMILIVLGLPEAAVVLFVLVKLRADLWAHFRDHNTPIIVS